MFSDIPIYHYDPGTKEHVATTMAALDPEEKKRGREIPLVPGCATLKIPEPAPVGMVNVFDESADAWQQVEDHRGEIYWLPDGQQVTVSKLGPVNPAWLKQKPEPELNDVLARVRAVRSSMLAESDWTQMPDAPLTTSERNAWKECRQDLRDIPERLIAAWDGLTREQRLAWEEPTQDMLMEFVGREPWR